MLSRSLRDYLIGLTKNFTQYELYNILALKSKYSIRLFELFKSYSYQKRKEFPIDTLKELLYASNYVKFGDFRRRVLEPAIEEINEYTELTISYETIHKGKKVIAVKFIINRKEALDGYISYKKTIERINNDHKQVKGQMSIYDMIEQEENSL
jgi:plasmid replication initiation protein